MLRLLLVTNPAQTEVLAYLVVGSGLKSVHKGKSYMHTNCDVHLMALALINASQKLIHFGADFSSILSSYYHSIYILSFNYLPYIMECVIKLINDSIMSIRDQSLRRRPYFFVIVERNEADD
jgi:hypothetical protein